MLNEGSLLEILSYVRKCPLNATLEEIGSFVLVQVSY